MKPPPPPLLYLIFLLSATVTSAATEPTTPTPAPTSFPTSPTTKAPSSSPLDPKQMEALRSLHIPTTRDPCVQPSPRNATICDNSKPVRQLISLHLSNSSSDLFLSFNALKSLSSLRSLSFTDCHVSPVRFPSDLSLSLTSFSCIRSLRRLSGVWLSHFVNLTDLTVSYTPVSASGVYVILGNMQKLKTLTISHANLTAQREDTNFPHASRISLKNLSLASNSLSGSIPDSMSAVTGLVHVDLSNNQLNGTVPKFLSGLKVLNLEDNGLRGVLPINASFKKRLAVFKHGLPMSPLPSKESSADSESDSDYTDDGEADKTNKKDNHHGPSKVFLGLAIGSANDD
ncbi:putative Pentatricopeptide [Hibiscus syriacus]|uniref:Pentatricopeptide n=1 Tax=Hibiscus syriacus TaxID=106335 RepID=A0A6A3A8D8_HIBSY|nr:putative Pentatricopeptide [Hibiscus syriacus]